MSKKYKSLEQVGDAAAANFAAFKEQEKIVGFVKDPEYPDSFYGTGLTGAVQVREKQVEFAQTAWEKEKRDRGLTDENGGSDLPASYFTLKARKEELVDTAGELRVQKDKLKEIEAEGVEQYHKNGGEMHDLAVLEAHIGGVAINVEQPLTVGQQVPVRIEHSSEL